MSYVWTDIAIFRCPGCQDKVRIEGVQPFYKRLREPEPFDCPACGCTVIWAKRPIRIFQAGQWLFPLGFVFLFIHGYAVWSIPTFAVASAVMIVGMLTQRLVRYEAESEPSPHRASS